MRLKEIKTQATVTETSWFKSLSRLGHQWSHPQGYTKLAVEYAREMSNNKDLHPQEVIHKIVQDYPQEVNERALIDYINNLVKKGRLPQSLTAEDSNDTITYTNPNFDNEWDEATRYDEFKNIGKEKWIALAKTGKVVDYNTETVKKIKNTEAGDVKEFDKLDPKKQKRALQQISTGEVELPIVASYSDGWLELVGGNTRLTAAIKATGESKVWQFDVPDSLQEGLGDWSSNAWNRFKNLFRSDDEEPDDPNLDLKFKTDIKIDKDVSKRTELIQGPPWENIEEVKRMQERLEDLGYSVGPLGPDGKYGKKTAAGVKDFKRDYGLSGLSSKMDKFALMALYSKKQAPTTNVSTGPDADLKLPNRHAKIALVLNLISSAESNVGGKNRGYDAIYGGRNPKILNMTLEELYKDMKKRAPNGLGNKGSKEASGRYQFMYTTLKEVAEDRLYLDPKKTKFDKKTQDRLVRWHLFNYNGMGEWLNNRMSNDDFLFRLARTWRGLPKDSSGLSYGKQGVNKANVTYKTASSTLDQIQRA